MDRRIQYYTPNYVQPGAPKAQQFSGEMILCKNEIFIQYRNNIFGHNRWEKPTEVIVEYKKRSIA